MTAAVGAEVVGWLRAAGLAPLSCAIGVRHRRRNVAQLIASLDAILDSYIEDQRVVRH